MCAGLLLKCYSDGDRNFCSPMGRRNISEHTHDMERAGLHTSTYTHASAAKG